MKIENLAAATVLVRVLAAAKFLIFKRWHATYDVEHLSVKYAWE